MTKKIILISLLAIIFSAWPALVSESRVTATIAEGQTCGGGRGSGNGNGNTNQPADPCDPNNPTKQCNRFTPYTRDGHEIHWPTDVALAGIHYYTPLGEPNKSSILYSFSTWQTASNGKIKFFDDATGTIGNDPLNVSDGVNSVTFGPLSSSLQEGWYEDPNGHWGYLSLSRDLKANIITGSTMAWAPPETGIMYEADTILNSNLTWTTNQPLPTEYYVPNTMVHEVGHWLDLADLCSDANPNCGERLLTMYYGGGSPGITTYATLGTGDISGVKYFYP